MTLKRIMPFFVIIFTLTSCFRQASDTFDTVDSQGSNQEAATQVIAPTATEESRITIIAPGMDDLTPSEEPTATEDEALVMADDAPTDVPAQPTDAPTNLPPPTTDNSLSTLPTATNAAVTFITPASNFEVEIASATPAATATRASGLQATPSDGEEIEAEATPVGDCEYVVQAGDNAFRIAINNDVTLDDLLAVNDLPANPIIQPGQVLQLPDCEVGGTTAVEVETSAETTEEASVILEDGYRLHVVATGDNLLLIAREYGVTVNDILNANENLTDPNRITPGQELLIPPAEE